MERHLLQKIRTYSSHALPQRFNMDARVNLVSHQITPRAELKVLGL